MTDEKLLIATTNRGKAREITAFLTGLPVRVFCLPDLSLEAEFPEDGKTFLENAKGKSLFYSRQWEGLTLAEDSGLEIDALGGAPGIYSARFSGPRATDAKNNRKVLVQMKGVLQEKRKARFVCCLVLAQQDNILKVTRGIVRGIIAREEKGSFGFGYDPIFFYRPFGKTFGELLPAIKNTVSHRGRALRKMKVFLQSYLKTD